LNFEYYIARRVAQSGKRSFSRLIIRIAIVAIALSVAIMITATALIRGFKNEISSKIFDFWGHIHITHTTTLNLTNEEHPIKMDQTFYPNLDSIEQIEYEEESTSIFGGEKKVQKVSKGGVRHIQVFANRPGVIISDVDVEGEKGKTKKELEGLVFKGIWKDFDWEYLENAKFKD